MFMEEFKKGDTVVYPSHGIGVIVDETEQDVAGVKIELYNISFIADNMTLRLPKNRAKSTGLRGLSTKESILHAVEVLRDSPKSARGMWNRREQEYIAKINSGNIDLLAEVLRDLHANISEPDERSYSEKVIYDQALNRFVNEYAATMDVDIDESRDEILYILEEMKMVV